MAPARKTLAEILEGLPAAPGVYIMKDARGKPIYIGKAAILRNRVRQYFQPASGDSRDFVPLLDGIVGDIETVITSNEKEALLLENTLIKRHQPRFNVKLKDDKNYLVLRLDPEAEWPRLEVVRKLGNDGAYYFGPYHSATSCREALRVVNRHFQLRTCTDHVLHNRRRPCLQYQIKRCPAPCVLPVAPRGVRRAGARRAAVPRRQERRAVRAADRADEGRRGGDRVRDAPPRSAIRSGRWRRRWRSSGWCRADFVDQDVIGFHREGIALEIAVMSIRAGKLAGSRNFSFTGQEFPDAELLSSFLGLYYDLGGAAARRGAAADRDRGRRAEGRVADREAGRAAQAARRPAGRRSRSRSRSGAIAGALVELATKNAAASFATRRNARADSRDGARPSCRSG